jgi:hypothetical protein
VRHHGVVLSAGPPHSSGLSAYLRGLRTTGRDERAEEAGAFDMRCVERTKDARRCRRAPSSMRWYGRWSCRTPAALRCPAEFSIVVEPSTRAGSSTCDGPCKEAFHSRYTDCVRGYVPVRAPPAAAPQVSCAAMGARHWEARVCQVLVDGGFLNSTLQWILTMCSPNDRSKPLPLHIDLLVGAVPAPATGLSQYSAPRIHAT